MKNDVMKVNFVYKFCSHVYYRDCEMLINIDKIISRMRIWKCTIHIADCRLELSFSDFHVL